VTPPALEVRDVVIRYATRRHGEVLAVDHVSLTLARGEALALVGESGCGKSSLARAIVGVQPVAGGAIELGGRTVDARRDLRSRRAAQMVFQDPYSSLNPRMTVRQTLAEVLQVHRLAPRERRGERCVELLELVGLSGRHLDSYPGQLSGGQRQRVGIARALAVEPDVLVADEPVSALDVSVQATVVNLLRDLRERLGLSMLFISHNLAVVRELCDRVAVMYLGRIVETAATEALFRDPRHPYTRALLAAIPALPGDAVAPPFPLTGGPPAGGGLPHGCRFQPRCPLAVDRCREDSPELLPPREGDARAVACHLAHAPVLATPSNEGTRP
jgi:oligopeptide/dipeptide ABC transporter ATP-binding protein